VRNEPSGHAASAWRERTWIVSLQGKFSGDV